ncbi:MAG: histidine phosphatase family protein [Cyclobacteriaceae bacterium]
MGKKLILVRHGQAHNPDGNRDFDRALTQIGQRDTRHLGRWLSEVHHDMDHIISSSALRAKETADNILDESKLGKVQFEDELYEASVRTMLATVGGIDNDYQSVVLVGHNPTITFFADYLAAEPVSGMEPGTATIITFECESWAELSQSSGVLIAQRRPSDDI